MLAAREVPFPLPLSEPPVSVRFTEERLRSLVLGGGLPATVDVRLCRDQRAAIRQALPPASLVLVGGRKHWWPGRAQTLAAVLARDGHNVVFVDAAKFNRKDFQGK